MRMWFFPGARPGCARGGRPRPLPACCVLLALAVPLPAHPCGIDRLLTLPLERLLRLTVVSATATPSAHAEPYVTTTTGHLRSGR